MSIMAGATEHSRSASGFHANTSLIIDLQRKIIIKTFDFSIKHTSWECNAEERGTFEVQVLTEPDSPLVMCAMSMAGIMAGATEYSISASGFHANTSLRSLTHY